MRYRDSVCAVIRRRSDGRVLVCHRNGYAPAEGWQFPQGGVDTDRDLVDELKRELREEIGTDDITVVSITDIAYAYDFPEYARDAKPGYDGQRQRWVLAELNTGEAAIRFDHEPREFDRFEWVEASEALRRVVDFKQAVYKQALSDLGLIAVKARRAPRRLSRDERKHNKPGSWA